MPANIKPIPYGDHYGDLANFLEDMVQLRIREAISRRPLVGRSPYTVVRHTADVLQQYHYSVQALPFCGRADEMHRLQMFLGGDQKFLWWAITGQAGSGKSRLGLEFLKNLPGGWFGFFVNDNASKKDIESFVPFTNTVLVIDYVANREVFAANVIHEIKEKFDGLAYKVRFLLIERENSKNASSWYHKLMRCYGRYDAGELVEGEYGTSFLQLGDLDRPAVEQLIGEVMKQKGLPADSRVG